jgi:ammonia channel protein AmtB
LSGAASGCISFLIKKYLMRSHLGNHIFDLRALCNGFLAGAVGVSVGSGAMQPYYAVLAGVMTAPFYLFACVMFRNFQVDDPMENIHIYMMPVIWGSINSVVF